MTHIQSPQFEKFKKVLREVFMLDHAELDFGIYRVMNQKRNEIETYLNELLAKQVTEVLTANAGSRRTELQTKLDNAIKNAKDLGIAPEQSPKVKELIAQMEDMGTMEDLENSVYNHLAIFFSRYYDSGDFISQRRYKKDVYAIPYEGEEVKLYWANADQYYIKTGEYFKNYSFRLTNGKRVEFTLKEASTEQNNNKAKDKMERRFALFNELPIEEVEDTLHIYFTYELMPKATKQKKLMEDAYDTIKPLLIDGFMEYAEVFVLRPTDADRNRTLLQKHLTDYVARNTFDYFIHKDLHGFLTRELDFYIKNEVMFIDDIDAQHELKFLSYLSMIKALKAIGGKIITFLASLEDFQKKLWLKKKFVTETNYCITLDRVPESLYPQICENEAQRKEWVRLFAINEIEATSGDVFEESKSAYTEPLTEKFLKENPFLVLDTAFFSEEFKHQLIESIDNIDEQCDGLLINSENFQALELLQEKYREQIRGVYYDPPYNTKKNEFIYKDSMKHSSWITMMNDRLSLTKNLMSNTAGIMISNDENENTNLRMLGNLIFGDDNYLSEIIWEGSSKNDQKYLSISHEYISVFLKDKSYLDGTDIRWLERKEGLDKIYSAFDNIRQLYPNDYERQTAEIKKWFKSLPDSEPAKKQKHFCIAEKRGFYFPADISKPENGYYYELLHPVTGKPCKKPKGGWRFIESTMEEQLRDDRIHFGADETTVPCRKSFLKETEYESPSTVIYLDNRVSTALIKNLFNDKKIFDNPKYYLLIARLIKLMGDRGGVYLDIFAGSGTTAHSIIHLNREDQGNRKYILCEMGDYFNTVTKPRIEKVTYSKDWKDGKPVSREGCSHCFKYIRLEQYEDTLNNLVIADKSDLFNDRFKESYLLGYMLDTETRGSLFNTDWFVNPFEVKLYITRNNETKEQVIDIVETFNYLIGLNVETMSYPQEGVCVVTGHTQNSKKILVIWRDCNKISNEALNEFFKSRYNSVRNREFDRIYVNGDNTLENVKKNDENWKVVLTEQVFKEKMFEEV